MMNPQFLLTEQVLTDEEKRWLTSWYDGLEKGTLVIHIPSTRFKIDLRDNRMAGKQIREELQP